MKPRSFFSFCCVLFVFAGLMASCGKQSSTQEPVAISGEPAVEKPVAKPDAGAAIVAKKEPSAAEEESAARRVAELHKREAEKNAPKPKIIRVEDLPVVEVTVKQGEYFEYGTDMGGDEQGAGVNIQARHSLNSHIRRDQTTGFEAVYKYRSKIDYVGKDSVRLEYSDHQPGSGPGDPGITTKTYQVINITVVKELPGEEEKPSEKPATNKTAGEKKEPAPSPVNSKSGKVVYGYPKTIKPTVKNSAEYQYRTGFGGDEQGASIKVQAGHFEKSEIVRDASTGFEPVYKYKSKGGYVGKDSVELWLVDHEIGSGPDDPGKTTKTRVVINFTITE